VSKCEPNGDPYYHPFHFLYRTDINGGVTICFGGEGLGGHGALIHVTLSVRPRTSVRLMGTCDELVKKHVHCCHITVPNIMYVAE
jgi:hypothetical protein